MSRTVNAGGRGNIAGGGAGLPDAIAAVGFEKFGWLSVLARLPAQLEVHALMDEELLRYHVVDIEITGAAEHDRSGLAEIRPDGRGDARGRIG